MKKGLFVLLLLCVGAAQAGTWQVGDLTTYPRVRYGIVRAAMEPEMAMPVSGVHGIGAGAR